MDQNNNSFTPNNPQPTPTPPPTPNPTPIGPTFESPILSPTHYDQITADQQAAQASMKTRKAPDNAKNLTVISIILGIVAVIGIALGVWGLVDAMATRDELTDATAALNSANEIVDKIASETGITINNVEDVPDYAPIGDTIYISEWGIKIKIPDNLHEVSYILDAKYRPQLCVSGLESSITNVFPTFADIDRNPGGLGCLTQVDVSEGNADGNGYSFGELAYTSGNYNYFYTAPANPFSTDPSEQNLEQTSVQIIKTMLTTNVSSYK